MSIVWVPSILFIIIYNIFRVIYEDLVFVAGGFIVNFIDFCLSHKLFMKMVPGKPNCFSSVKKILKIILLKPEKGSFLSIKSSVNLKGNPTL